MDSHSAAGLVTLRPSGVVTLRSRGVVTLRKVGRGDSAVAL